MKDKEKYKLVLKLREIKEHAKEKKDGFIILKVSEIGDMFNLYIDV